MNKVLIDIDEMDFELFKSDICQSIKKLDPREAIRQINDSNAIEILFNRDEYCKSFYLVAIVNYLSNKNNLNLNIHDYDNYKLKNTVYPRNVELLSSILQDKTLKEKAVRNAEKEFMQFNICEGEIENVY